jgi:hypothetical protein
MSKLNFARIIYDSEGGMGEAYYAYDGRVWARWETDFPEGDDNFGHRLAQLTRIQVAKHASSRMLTAPDLGDFPLLYMSDPGYMVVSNEEKAALARYPGERRLRVVRRFLGRLRVAAVRGRDAPGAARPRMAHAPARPSDLPHGVRSERRHAADSGVAVREPRREHRRTAGAHKFPAGNLDTPEMRAWLDDDGRIMVLATHNTDVGDGWEREAYGEWYFETFSTKSYMVGVNVLIYAMTH